MLVLSYRLYYLSQTSDEILSRFVYYFFYAYSLVVTRVGLRAQAMLASDPCLKAPVHTPKKIQTCFGACMGLRVSALFVSASVQYGWARKKLSVRYSSVTIARKGRVRFSAPHLV